MAVLVFVGVAVAAAPAHADPSPADAALAETLFRQGKELMAQRRFDDGCPKLAESYRLDPGTGTLLALALCHEGQGRLATAWIEYTDVQAATADARPDRALLAREHIASLEPALSRVTVMVPPGLASTPGLEILRDGTRLDRAAWGVPVPVDGGPHTLEAHAPDRRAWTLRFDVATAREQRTIEIPSLDVEAARAVPASAAPFAPSSGPDVARQRWGVAVGAVGVVGLGVGTYFGVEAISKIHEAKSACPTAPSCTNASALTTNSDGLRDATVADVALGAGLVAVAIGAFLVVTGRASTPAAFLVVPSVGRTGASIGLAHAL